VSLAVLGLAPLDAPRRQAHPVWAFAVFGFWGAVLAAGAPWWTALIFATAPLWGYATIELPDHWFEYRAGVPVAAALIALGWVAPWALAVCVVPWAVRSTRRAAAFGSQHAYWIRVAGENPAMGRATRAMLPGRVERDAGDYFAARRRYRIAGRARPGDDRFPVLAQQAELEQLIPELRRERA
jgi:hypothetical protein